MAVSPHMRAQTEAALERVAGRYELVERLAQGGMGEVFLARELATGRNVALKRLLPSAHKRQALFRAEYHALARLKHPYIIEVYEFGVDKDLPYYTMEVLDGQDLRELPQVGFEESCRILRDVATSLALLHSQRFLHRDISPRNVRRTLSGVCKLLDFGTMVPFGLPNNLAGTPPFISPEAWEGSLLDQRSDLYSLGALAYWLFSRRLPGNSRSLDKPPSPREKLPPLSKVAKDVPPVLEELVMSLLDIDPGKRPSSAVEVIARLSALAGLPAQDGALLAQSHLVSSRMVGQKRSLAKVEKLLGRALVCNGGAALVQGAEGSGKTRFLQEVSLSAQTRGFSVVRAFGARAERGVAIARELYRGLRRAAPEAFDLLPARDREVLQSYDWQETTVVTGPASERRAQLQWALAAYFRVVAKSAPWLVLVDDLDLADEFSSALVTSISAMSETLPLLVVASAQLSLQRVERPAIAAFASRAQTVALTELDEKHTRSLISNVFGRVPNRERLVSFLYREARGNPALTMELCQFLLERGEIRYVEGAFVLPESEIRQELPAGTALAFSLRLTGLSPTARDVANLIATCRGGASLDLCLAASNIHGEEVLSALNELVSRGVLMGSGHDYVFAQEALRSGVSLSIASSKKRQLHERLAQAYLAVSGEGPLRKLEAAWHMVHTEQHERAGAELLAQITPPLIEAGVSYQLAVEGLAKALEVLERLGAPLSTRLAMRVQLARASYLYDYRLANRYADDTMRLLSDWCGLPIAARWRKLLGQRGAFVLCIVLMTLRRLFSRPLQRGPSALTSFQYLGRAALSTLGVRLTALDREAATKLLGQLWIFDQGSKLSSANKAWAAASALCVQPFGREAEVESKLAVACRVIDERRPLDLEENELQDIRVGLLLSRGINECYRIGSRALLAADELESMGTHIAHAAAHRLRFTYYVVRGMREKAEHYRRELDLHGIQGGTTWQVDWFAVPIEGMASALLGDMVGAGHALARLEQLALDMPSLIPLREMVRVGYHMRRGEFARAIELGQIFVAAYPPRSVIGWGAAYSAYAAALNQSGRYAEARALCERALAALSPEDLQYVIMYGPLERELYLAIAASGQVAEAMSLADAYIQKLEQHGELALAAHAHECRVQVARAARDQSLLMHALIAMRDAAERTASSTVIEQAAKVTQASLRATRDLELSLAAPAEDLPSADASDQTPPGGVARTRRRTLLRRVAERARARSAFVLAFAENDGAPRLAASTGDPLALPPLFSAARELFAQPDDDSSGARRVSIEGREFDAVTLPKEPGQRPRILLLLEGNGYQEEELPMTLLARLAEGVRSELSLSQEAGDSVPDSDVSQTFG